MKQQTTRYLILFTVTIALVLTGCGGYKKPAEARKEEPSAKPTLYTLNLGDPALKDAFTNVAPGDIVDCTSGEKIGFDAMIETLAQADVVYLGESHTSMNVHQFQARVLKALAERGKELIIGMEFYQRDDAEILSRWSSGEIEEEEFIRESGWYASGGYNFGYYSPLLNVARENNFPVAGINIDRMIIRAISRGGLESLDEEQKAAVGDVDVANQEHRELIMFYFGGAAMTHGSDPDDEEARQRLDRMYAAQCAWDQVFADSTLQALEKHDEIFVMIVGSGHVAYKLGTNRRLEEISDLDTVTVYPVLVEGQESEKVRRSIGDILVGFEDDMEPAYYPSFGISARDHGGVIVTGMLFPGSLALQAGLQKDDVILSMDGEELRDSVDLRMRLAGKGWGETVVLGIRRAGEEMEIELTPEKD